MVDYAIVIVDPSPEGYLYGFPRPYDKEKDGNMDEWIKSFGYPHENYIVRQWYGTDA